MTADEVIRRVEAELRGDTAPPDAAADHGDRGAADAAGAAGDPGVDPDDPGPGGAGAPRSDREPPGGDAWGRGGKASSPSPERPRTFAEIVGDAVARMRARREGSERAVPLPWVQTSAALHGGLWPGCHILVGGTKAGKTQWAFHATFHALTRGVPCAYVGLELDELGIVARMLPFVIQGRQPWRDYYYGREDAIYNLDNHPDALAELAALPFYPETAEARGWDYGRLTGLVARMREAHPEGPLLVVVDFLQLVTAPESRARDALREIIGGAAYAARMAARQHGAAVLLLSSAARAHYPLFHGTNPDGSNGQALGTGDPGRFIGTGKESGEVEYSADTVLALCREPYQDGGGTPATWLAVAASRTGVADNGRGWVRYAFQNGTTFTEENGGPVKPPPKGQKANRAAASTPPSRPPHLELLTQAYRATDDARKSLGAADGPKPADDLLKKVEADLGHALTALCELDRIEPSTYADFIGYLERRNGPMARRVHRSVKARTREDR